MSAAPLPERHPCNFGEAGATKSGWNGRPARPGGQLARRNCGRVCLRRRAAREARRQSRSAGRVARRDRRVACATRISGCSLLARRLSFLPAPDDAPDAPMLVIAARVGERLLVVADDRIVEVRDPERAVGAELHLDGAEPRVVAREEVGHLDRLRTRAVPLVAVAIDPARNRIAVEGVAPILLRKLLGGVVGDAGDRR